MIMSNITALAEQMYRSKSSFTHRSPNQLRYAEIDFNEVRNGQTTKLI